MVTGSWWLVADNYFVKWAPDFDCTVQPATQHEDSMFKL